MNLRETNCKVYVGFKPKNETKDGFVLVNSSNARIEMVWFRCGVNDEISGEEMV